MSFLDSKHGRNWYIWEFRAEGTGYQDSEVFGRIHHFPWPDHHPPPFAIIPAIMESMRSWLHGADKNQGNDSNNGGNSSAEYAQEKPRVAVVHCKAGKGRSGTIACGYLISEEGWSAQDALDQFTKRRMRVGFGSGVSIPSQLRWVRYIECWAKEMGKRYEDRRVEILELHVWGLRDGVKVAVDSFVDGGKKVKCFHLFGRNEVAVIDNGKTEKYPSSATTEDSENRQKKNSGTSSPVSPATSASLLSSPGSTTPTSMSSENVTTATSSPRPKLKDSSVPEKRLSAVLLRPAEPLIVPSSDVKISLERQKRAPRTNWTVTTSIAHVWFNAYFEGGDDYDSGVFETEWDSMDGIKGTPQKGVRALERLKVVWRYP